MRYAYLILVFGVVLIISLFGFRGQTFTKPPIEVFPEWAFPGMKYQPKYQPQAESKFFADGRADRPLPPGVVVSSYGPAGQPLRDDDHLNRGKTATGTWAAGFPRTLTIDFTFMQRGRDRFAIYCQPCHGAHGDGQGITKAYGMGATPTYHDDRLRKMAEGEIFNTITNGKNNMLPYADKLPPEDRWAVIAYVRALQRAQQGTPADVPAEHQPELDTK
jgi:mono/diheme cytochrome c family protein